MSVGTRLDRLERQAAGSASWRRDKPPLPESYYEQLQHDLQDMLTHMARPDFDTPREIVFGTVDRHVRQTVAAYGGLLGGEAWSEEDLAAEAEAETERIVGLDREQWERACGVWLRALGKR